MTSGDRLAFPPGRYPGGKNGAGVYQQIINQMPPHEIYIETHLGSGALLRRKRPARYNLGIDIDPGAIAAFDGTGLDALLIQADATEYLSAYPFTGRELVYADPPYWPDSRKDRSLYRYEMTREQHAELLDVLTALPCLVIVSGYWSDYYAQRLKGWRTHTFQAMTRHGLATEWLWMNFDEPTQLHDYRYLGADYRERERIKRKVGRWTTKLQAMDRLERQALLAALQEAIGDPHHRSPVPAVRAATPERIAMDIRASSTAEAGDPCRHTPTESAATAATAG
jgi:DNA adenine methylase